MNQPSMVIVPGASSLPELYDPLVKAVTARGLDTEALHLPSIGTPGPRAGAAPTMYDDVTFIAAHVRRLADAGKDVHLIAHSYGGVPATESVRELSKKNRIARGLLGGIIGIAYMTAVVPNVGESAGSLRASMPEETKAPATVDENGWMSFTDLPKLASLTFSDMPEKEGLYWAAKLAHHSANSLDGELTHAGFKDVPVSYLLCLNDLTIPAEFQRAGIDMVERETGKKVAVTSIEADHFPALTHTDEVVDWILGMAGKTE